MIDTPKPEAVIVRFDPAHLVLVDEAAAYLGLGRGPWMRALALREAREVLAAKAGDPREAA